MVKIGGLALPAIMIAGIIAAIALPAYQGYMQRAKAAQVVKP
jgi:Tfp pilus assembly major pilin PilA